MQEFYFISYSIISHSEFICFNYADFYIAFSLTIMIYCKIRRIFQPISFILTGPISPDGSNTRYREKASRC